MQFHVENAILQLAAERGNPTTTGGEMDFLTALSTFAEWAKKNVQKLIELNGSLRNEIHDVVNELCTALTDGLDLVIIRLRAAERMEDGPAKNQYIVDSESHLIKSFSEFKICANLRKLEDRLNRLFDPLRAALSVGSVGEVKNLINSLDDHEIIVIDMINLRFSELIDLASLTNSNPHAINDALSSTIEESKKKRQAVIDIGRSIIDKM